MASKLSEAFGEVEGLFTHAEYREIEGYRFRHDAKRHHHDALSATIRPSGSALEMRHWTIQDIFDSRHVDDTLVRAAQYGMNGIQFSGDNIYWVNDSLHRYNTYVFTGQLCEKCHDLGLKAYFWTHEINGFFHEYVKNGQYGCSGQLVGGSIDMSSNSGIWDMLYDKYDVFFRRQKGVDGLVLTLNECQVPVFRDDCIESDLDAAERVAKIGRTIKAACEAHGRDLILRTFCYSPAESKRVADGVRRIGSNVKLMIKCVPHDWQTFYPNDPLIAELKEFPRIVEFDLAHEPMGAGRFPYPDTEHIKARFDHIVEQGVMGVAGRIDRFRNHAAGTLNRSNVYSFSRLAREPGVSAGELLRTYAALEFGLDSTDTVIPVMKTFYEAGQQTFFLAREWASQHSNINDFSHTAVNERWNRAVWMPESEEAKALVELLRHPTPAFIEQIIAEKTAVRESLEKLWAEWRGDDHGLEAGDAAYLRTMAERSLALGRVLTLQHEVMLMVRHDLDRAGTERRYTGDIARRLTQLRQLAQDDETLLRDAGNEGCQYGPELVEHFCRNVESHLTPAVKASL
jgi:hypothetical protein